MNDKPQKQPTDNKDNSLWKNYTDDSDPHFWQQYEAKIAQGKPTKNKFQKQPPTDKESSIWKEYIDDSDPHFWQQYEAQIAQAKRATPQKATTKNTQVPKASTVTAPTTAVKEDEDLSFLGCMIGLVVIALAIFLLWKAGQYLFTSNDEPKTKSTTTTTTKAPEVVPAKAKVNLQKMSGLVYRMQAFASKQGIVIWCIDRNQQLYIFDAATQEVIKKREIPLMKVHQQTDTNYVWTKMWQAGNEIYNFDNPQTGLFEARNVLTGEVTQTIKNLEKACGQFLKQISYVGTVDEYHWVTVTDANTYQRVVYNLLTQEVASYEDYFNKIRKNRSSSLVMRKWRKDWTFVKNDSNVQLQKPVQVKFDKWIYKPTARTLTAFNQTVKEGHIKFITHPDTVSFLHSPEVLYADSTLAIIKHRSQADPQSYELMCLEANGKVLWNKPAAKLSISKILMGLVSEENPKNLVNYTRHKNTLAISYTLSDGDKELAVVFGLSLVNGDLLWEYNIHY